MYITCYISKAGKQIFEHSYTPNEEGTGESSKDVLKLFQSIFPGYSHQDADISLRFEMNSGCQPAKSSTFSRSRGK
jgi:hypothetical protein